MATSFNDTQNINFFREIFDLSALTKYNIINHFVVKLANFEGRCPLKYFHLIQEFIINSNNPHIRHVFMLDYGNAVM